MAAPKSLFEMFQAMKGNIEEKTGKSFDQWIAITKRAHVKKFTTLLNRL